MNEPINHPWMLRLQSLFGLLVLVLLLRGIGIVRRGKSPFPWRVVLWGIGLQFVFALLVLYTPHVLESIQFAVQRLLDFTRDGARLVFGKLADYSVPVTPGPYDPDSTPPMGYAQSQAVFAFFVLPTIIFFSSLTAIAYHSGVMQWVVQGLAWLMQKTMGTSGAETLASAANVFVGQTEAPLIIRPFVLMATRSELMAVMVGGFANIASGVLGIYAQWLGPFVTGAAGHLASACLITAPGSLMVAKLLLPEREVSQTAGRLRVKIERLDANVFDAAARGASEGLALALNVAAMLIAFTALVSLLNAILGGAGGLVGVPSLSLEGILGTVGAPFAWLCGIPWGECPKVGALLGIKTVLNELVAYRQMRDALAGNTDYFSPRTAVIAMYALCGFANFASIGIQIGGIATLAPERRSDLSRIGMEAMLGGAVASLMGAAVVGVLL